MRYGRRKLEDSVRRACRVIIGQPRSTQRCMGQKVQKDRDLVERMVQLAKENPRYGYRRVWALLRREGRIVNIKGGTSLVEGRRAEGSHGKAA